MNTLFLGGNQIKQIDFFAQDKNEKIDFAKCSYQYYLVSLQPGMRHYEHELMSCTILCLESKTGAAIIVDDKVFDLKQGDAAQIENHLSIIEARESASVFLVAGVLKSHLTSPHITITSSNAHKKIIKPWGHELWFNGEHPGYCLKEVMIKQGFRTSLQYHNFKEETNVLMKGQAELVYKQNEIIPIDEVVPEDLGSISLLPMSIMHITPKILHRLVAVTDVVLYEASTPFLDDVIRVKDDSSRHHGRVFSEHST